MNNTSLHPYFLLPPLGEENISMQRLFASFIELYPNLQYQLQGVSKRELDLFTSQYKIKFPIAYKQLLEITGGSLSSFKIDSYSRANLFNFSQLCTHFETKNPIQKKEILEIGSTGYFDYDGLPEQILLNLKTAEVFSYELIAPIHLYDFVASCFLLNTLNPSFYCLGKLMSPPPSLQTKGKTERLSTDFISRVDAYLQKDIGMKQLTFSGGAFYYYQSSEALIYLSLMPHSQAGAVLNIECYGPHGSKTKRFWQQLKGNILFEGFGT